MFQNKIHIMHERSAVTLDFDCHIEYVSFLGRESSMLTVTYETVLKIGYGLY